VYAALRAAGTAVIVIALYFLLPLSERSNVRTVTELIGAIVLLAAIVAWQVRAILRSDHPTAVAIEALAVAVPLYMTLFAAAYFLLAKGSSAEFGQHLSRTTALYFSVTVFATVGFGDITAKTDVARLLVTVQMIANLVFVGLGVRILVGATRFRLSSRPNTGGGGQPPGRDDLDLRSEQ
jgi:voltage-gated potassium channel